MAKPLVPLVKGHHAELMKQICFGEIRKIDRRMVNGKSLAGLGPREESRLAIYQDGNDFYIFTCDADWNVMWDGWAISLENAISAAEDRSPGFKDRCTWRKA